MTISQLGATGKLDPKAQLHNLLEEADDFEDLVVVVRRKDNRAEIWATTGDAWMFWGASMLIADLAMKHHNEQFKVET